MYDLLIRRGRVFDGSGGASRVADVAIKAGEIAAIGDLGDAASLDSLDVDGDRGGSIYRLHPDLLPEADQQRSARLARPDGPDASGGAHSSVICDASATTTMLAYWTRDRERGERLPLAQVVRKLTAEPADLYGFAGRGWLEAGAHADINVIDYERLSVGMPEMHYDLPAGGKGWCSRPRATGPLSSAASKCMRMGASPAPHRVRWSARMTRRRAVSGRGRLER